MKFWCVRGKGKYIVEENPYGFLMGMLLNKGIYIEVHKITLANQKLHTAILGLICFLSLHSRAEYYIVDIISVLSQRLRVFQFKLKEKDNQIFSDQGLASQ